jgi:hypothetical protein
MGHIRPTRQIFIDDSQINHIGNSVFSDKVTPVRAITMDGFTEENQIDSVGLLKVNIEGTERLLIALLKRFRK